MFAPPPAYSTWYLMEGTLRNGSKIDLLDGLPAINKTPPLTHAYFKEEPINKFLRYIKQPKGRRFSSTPWGEYACRQWNKQNPLKPLHRVRLIQHIAPIVPGQKTNWQEKATKSVVFAVDCPRI